MKAIGFTHTGGPEVLHPLELPRPEAGQGEVLIKVRFAAVNPVDAIIRTGAFAGIDVDASHPVVPGMDVAGTIEAIGPDQAEDFDLAIGDHVTGFVVPSGTHGGYSECIVLPSRSVAGTHAEKDTAAAASFLSNALTAEIALENLDLPTGATFAVTGAAGAVGGYLVELAARRGLVVIADATDEDRALVTRLGATHVVRRGADFVGDVIATTGGRGADALGDGATLGGAVLGAVRDGGQIAYFLPNDAEQIRGITPFFSYVMRSSTRHDAIQGLVDAVARGELTTRVADVYPAVEAAAAHERLERGGLRGRLILEF
ncbi:NADP-dependent oxidoreductase [Microbacterium sp. PMB16]|uniref:NADP-dependent oxidoreductase n=1 Tax=Microbacterium sp. PMB16 TaxID=3120157 RepID=UPI003F4C8A32